jgi:hypothetical protein
MTAFELCNKPSGYAIRYWRGLTRSFTSQVTAHSRRAKMRNQLYAGLYWGTELMESVCSYIEFCSEIHRRKFQEQYRPLALLRRLRAAKPLKRGQPDALAGTL